jgi:hypothetical protein
MMMMMIMMMMMMMMMMVMMMMMMMMMSEFAGGPCLVPPLPTERSQDESERQTGGAAALRRSSIRYLLMDLLTSSTLESLSVRRRAVLAGALRPPRGLSFFVIVPLLARAFRHGVVATRRLTAWFLGSWISLRFSRPVLIAQPLDQFGA